MNAMPKTEGQDVLVQLARAAVHATVCSGKMPLVPDVRSSSLAKQAGVFVSIKKAGQLRGCIGTFLPTEETLAHEVISNAAKSATQDPRFPPIRPEELDELEISVDVLSAPQPCERDQLDPSQYGVLVESGWKRGLLLPDLEGVETVDDQLSIAKRKAGIGPEDPVHLYRFTVERHT
jgi:AmmeMemoRadiSam system protein A